MPILKTKAHGCTAVGRWQKNKDLNWYAKSKPSGANLSEADARKEEIRRVKEAEADALARALGYDVPPRPIGGNPNMTALGGVKEVEKVIKESVEDGGQEGDRDGRGLGFGAYGGGEKNFGGIEEVMEGSRGRAVLSGVETGNGRSRPPTGQDIAERSTRGDKRSSRSRDRGERRDGHRHRHRTTDRRHRHDSRSRSRSRDRRRSRSRDRTHGHGTYESRRRHDQDDRLGMSDERRRRRSRSPYDRNERSDRRRRNRTDNY